MSSASRSVDVVVVSYNSSGHIRQCVEPLLGVPGVQVVVVDNASSDGSVEVVRNLPVATIQLPTNRGFAAGVNAGWRTGSAPYVLLLNPDARIEGDALDALAQRLESDGATGAVAPRILTGDGLLDFSQRRFPRLRSTFARALYLHRVFPYAAWTDELVRDESAYSTPGTPEWVSGACMLLRREALAAVDGLDEGFFMYSEDTDLCRRLRLAGWEIAFEPAAVVQHVGGASRPRAELLPALAASRVRYAQKHHGRLVESLERLGLALEALTHSVGSRGGLAVRAGHVRSLLAVAGVRRG